MPGLGEGKKTTTSKALRGSYRSAKYCDVMPGRMSRYAPKSHLHRQYGMTLVPVIITVFIFSLLITQVVIPLQNRDLREATLQATHHTAEQLIQAAIAFRADPGNNNSWPSYIDQPPDLEGNYDNSNDIVPKYLPIFTNRNPWGGDWRFIMDPQGEGMLLLTETHSHSNATALVQKMGPSAALCNFTYTDPAPDSNSQSACIDNNETGTAVKIALVAPAPSFVESLTVGRLYAGSIEENSEILSYSSVQNNQTMTQSLGGSSERFKDNIQTLDTDLEHILALQPVSYTYKPAYQTLSKPIGGKSQVGLIAEHVETVIPELVIYQDGQAVNVDYEKLSVMVLKLAQGLKQDIEHLQAENSQLQKRLKALEKNL